MAEDGAPAEGPPRGASGPTLLYGGHVLVAGAGGPELREREVLFDGRRVAVVGRAVTLLPGTRVVDAQGCLVAALREGAHAGEADLAASLVPVRPGGSADLVVLSLARPPASADPASAVDGAVVRQVFRGGVERVAEDGAAREPG